MTDPDATDELPFIQTGGFRVTHAALGEEAGRCGIAYPGAAGRCSNDAEYRTSFPWGGDFEIVPICRKHAEQYASCFCEGDSLDWEYHTEDGCADTRQALSMVTGGIL